MSDPAEKLAAFVAWAAAHITGDEKGQAQIFLDRLFQAFGHAGSLDVGGEPEFRVRKATEDGGGTSFADYVWKPVVLIEMKKRGTVLSKHYRQAFDYWTRLVPGRPRYVILCNFDEFHVYDFETQMDSPVGRAKLADLAEHYGPLAFLLPGQPKPVFDNEHVAVTREAAANLAKCFNKLTKRGIERPLAQRFILQTLIALFAEDIGLLEKYFVTRLLDECDEKTSYDLLGGLFSAMNKPGGNAGGRYKGVPYFNGGVFSTPAEIELTGPEIVILRACSLHDWSKVQPEIFGTVFEQTLGKEERHAQGAHFTHPADIMKIVKPTITDPWTEQIESAKTAKRLGELLHRIQHFRVLDPACGSGNFLYMAYRELKRLEARIYERLDTEFPSKSAGEQMRMSYLSAQNFFGMDLNPFAIELTKVTMMIGRKLAIDELHITERALPLDNLDRNFIATDALIRSSGDFPVPVSPADSPRDWKVPATRTPWPQADVIIGNPPFLGAKILKPELGPDYVNTLRKLYPEVPGMADLCVYWIRRAHDHLAPCTAADPVAGRAGLVGTQNIRNNASRIGGLDHVVKDGTIIEAVDNQPWSGEANVHVSIANWVKTQDPALLPKTRRLWFKVEPSAATKKQWKAQGKKAAKEYELIFRDVSAISSALSDQTDVSGATALSANEGYCYTGQYPRSDGFHATDEEANAMLRTDVRNAEVLKPFLVGGEMLTTGSLERWVVDFQMRSILDAQSYAAPFKHVQERVMPSVVALAESERAKTGKENGQDQGWLKTWWRHFRPRPELVGKISALTRYIVCSRITKRPIFVFVSPEIRPGDALSCFAFSDDYSFGILQSHAHWLWFITKCSKMKSDFRYTPESVFDTFPWPQFAPVPGTPAAGARDGHASGSAGVPPAGFRVPRKPPGVKQTPLETDSAATLDVPGGTPATAGGTPTLPEADIARIEAVATAGREVRRIRAEALPKLKGGLRALYRTLELPGANPLKDAHAALDAAVLAAYDFSPKADLLAQLLILNQTVATRIERAEPVTAPGIPAGFPNPQGLVTADCIRPTG